MTDRSAPSYEALLTYLRDNYRMSAQIFISDFESAIHVAIKIVFPDCQHLGCWFHFAQASEQLKTLFLLKTIFY